MTTTTSRNRRTGIVAATATVMAGSLAAAVLVGGGSASALPTSQGVCEFNFRSVTVADGWQPLTTARSITRGENALVKAEVAVDMGVSPLAEVRLGWSINGAAPLENNYGPANLANQQDFYEGRELFGLIPVKANVPTRIQPFVRVSGIAGKSTQFVSRCFTIEGRTS